MTKRYLTPIGLVSLAVADGDTTPSGVYIGALAWSTTLGKVITWNGGAWRAQASGSGSATGTNTGDQVNISGNAATASAVAWAGVSGKPTTVAGYGITDTVALNSGTTPRIAGTADIGTGTTSARADHVHPAQVNISGNAAGLSTTLAVVRGGTGATTLSGLVKGNGTSAMTAAVAGTDFIQSIAGTTTTINVSVVNGVATLSVPDPFYGLGAIVARGNMRSNSNNVHNCGLAEYSWANVYAANGVIQTSDARDKNEIQGCDLGLDFITALHPVSYRWIDPLCNQSKRYGMIAQEVQATLAGREFAGLEHCTETDRYSINYSEFISPLIAAVQELSQRVDRLQVRLDSLA